jgi:PAS domain S-box-containing protein
MDETLILLADGSRESAESIKNLLEESGYVNIIIAKNAGECINKASEFNPQLLVIDFDLGKAGGGLEILKAIRKEHPIPVVFLAGSPDEAMVSLAHETEPCIYIKKPVTLIDIYSGVHSLLARIRAEALLREREKRYKDLVEEINDVIYSIDNNGIITFISPRIESMTGYSPEDAVGKSFTGFIHPDDLQAVADNMKLLTQGVSNPMEYRITRKNGSYVWGRFSSRAVIEGGITAGFRGVITDITKEKKAEEYLAFQAMILDQIGERITVTDFDGKIIYINEAVSSAFGLSKQKIIGNSTEFYGDDPGRGATQNQILMETLAKGEWSGEVVNIAPDGRELLMDCSVRMVRNPDGTPRALCGIARDITDKKAAENLLRESLAEKEILLKEIHHRVKNNLQIIVSLLNLQSGHITDPEALQSYEESQNRIRAMALIHENLYQSGSFSKILFGEYIKSLTADIYSTCKSADRSITLDFDLDEIFISMDRAIPCALILNELLTNAFKYAFPPEFSGVPRICISLKELPDGNNLILEVADNGVGITSGAGGAGAGSFGMTLVSLMAAQIKGNYTAVSDRGVKAVLVFGKK